MTPRKGRLARGGLGVVLGGMIALAADGAAMARPVDDAAVPVGADVVLSLDNFDTVRGRVIEVSNGVALIENEIVGQVRVPLSRVTSAAIAPSPEQAAQEAEELEAAREEVRRRAEEEEKNKTPAESSLSFWQGWKGNVGAGINGSDGNSETLSMRGTLGLVRATDELETAVGASYVYDTSEGEKTKSRGELTLRNDWIFRESPWGFFAQGKAEYDEFQDWDWRVSGAAGPTFTLIKHDSTSLRLRAGAGASRDFGGDSNDIVPEALFGVDLSHQLTAHQSLFANFEYLPSLKKFSDYRTLTKVGYEVVIDPRSKLSLRAGLEHRYDSEPGDATKKNDLEYFLMLVWTF